MCSLLSIHLNLLFGCLLSLLINRRRAGNSFNRTRIEEVSLEDSVVEVLMDSLGIE